MPEQYKDGDYGTMAASAVIEENRLVKVVSGQLAVCTATVTDRPIGVTVERAAAVGQVIRFKYINAGGTLLISTSSTVALGASVYPAANGLVGSTVTTSILGTALAASTVAGDSIEVLPSYQYA